MQALHVVPDRAGFDIESERPEETPVASAGIGNNRFQRGGKTSCLFDFRFQKRGIVADRMRDGRLEVGLRPDADFAVTARARLTLQLDLLPVAGGRVLLREPSENSEEKGA